MKSDIEMYQQAAQKKFMGRWPVIGIAIGGESGQRLVFLLEEHSLSMQTEILEWAKSIRVAVQIEVSGPITLLRSTL